MIEEALLYLLTNANPTGLTGAIIGLRLYPDELPQPPTYPALVYHMISAPRGYTMDGQDGATPFRVQFDGYGTTVKDARDLIEAVRRDLSGYQGDVPISPPVRIHGAFVDNQDDSAEPSLETAGPRVKRRSMDVIVWTKEP